MNAEVARQSNAIAQLCRRHHVARLDIFGSAALGADNADSDFDFVVEFQPLEIGAYSGAYFGLLESLERLLGRPVDLVVERAISNPYFRESVEATRKRIYAA